MKLASFFLLSALLFSSNALAISDSELASQCFEVGKAKIAAQAEAFGCQIDISKIEIEGIDNRWYNPSKYIWYQVVAACNESDRVIALVQLYNGECF